MFPTLTPKVAYCDQAFFSFLSVCSFFIAGPGPTKKHHLIMMGFFNTRQFKPCTHFAYTNLRVTFFYAAFVFIYFLKQPTKMAFDNTQNVCKSQCFREIECLFGMRLVYIKIEWLASIVKVLRFDCYILLLGMDPLNDSQIKEVAKSLTSKQAAQEILNNFPTLLQSRLQSSMLI